jgi:hypothetical protein
MHFLARCAVPLGPFLLASASLAQPVPPPPRLEAPAAAASAARAVQTVTKTVIEDDQVRIEETRLRGAPQRIVVRSKLAGGKDYEIIVPAGGKDPSQDKGAAGQRAWSLFSF